MRTIIKWIKTNRNLIGYTVGGLNIASGVINMLIGNFYTGVFNIIVGIFISVDTWLFDEQ
jgi:hypothetical protein